MLLLTLVAGTARASAQSKDRPPPDVERLDGYLDRLGLANLQIRNLERELERAHSLTATTSIAARLAQVYADRLSAVKDEKQLADLTGRLNKLIAAHPAAGGPKIRVTLLEGDYNRAEPQALRWVANPLDEAARTDALARLAKCRPELDRARDELLERVKQLDDQADKLDAGPRRDAVEAELRPVSQSASRAVYFASWANFYERLLSPDSRGEGFRVARQGFRRLLGMDDEPVKADDFEGLDSEITARIALGLALSELAEGRRENAREAFRALRAPQVDRSVRDWVDRWHVWALLRDNQADEALSVAQAAIGGMAPPLTAAKAALCMLLARCRNLSREAAGGSGAVRQGELGDRLAALGIRGLIWLGRSDLARSEVGSRDLSLVAGPGAFSHWLRAQAALGAAETGAGAAKYSTALAEFRAALAEKPDPAMHAECRFGEACCLYRMGEVAQAGEGFRSAAAEWKAQKLPGADAEWMALVTQWSLADDPPAERIKRITEEARTFSQTYPGHPGAARADELVARLRQEPASPDTVTKEPAATGPTGESTAVADRFRQFELARAAGDRSAIREHATWLLQQPGAAAHERACLTALAEEADHDFQAAGEPDRAARAAAALDAHQRLASVLADFPDRLRTNPTLRLVYLRMARYGIEADKPEVALRYLNLLRTAKPDDPEILRLTGLANDRAGEYDRALECWRELLERLPRDSAPWFESKFHQIESIAQTDRGRARRVWEQFKALHPELGPADWPGRFRQLAARLEE